MLRVLIILLTLTSSIAFCGNFPNAVQAKQRASVAKAKLDKQYLENQLGEAKDRVQGAIDSGSYKAEITESTAEVYSYIKSFFQSRGYTVVYGTNPSILSDSNGVITISWEHPNGESN